MYDIGISFTFTRKRVHPVSPSDNPGRLKVAHRMPFSMRGQADDRVLAAQIQLASIAKGVSGKDVCTLQVRFDPDSIEITRREQVVCDLDLFGAHTIYSRTR